MFEVVIEGGACPLIAFEAIGQKMRFGFDIGLEEGAELDGTGIRQHGDPRTSPA